MTKYEGLRRTKFRECAAIQNFYIVSRVRRIKGFKRHQGEKSRAGTGDLEETSHLSREVDTEENKAPSCRDFYQEVGTLSESQKMWQHDKEKA